MQGSHVFVVFWFAGVLVLLPLWYWLSIGGRLQRNIPLRPRAPEHAQFLERFASGTSRDNFLGKAHNCLMVAVTENEVWITPIFPFNLIAPYRFMGLEYRFAKSAILYADLRKGLITGHYIPMMSLSFLTGRYVTLSFLDPEDARERSVTLMLKDPEAFMRAIGKGVA